MEHRIYKLMLEIMYEWLCLIRIASPKDSVRDLIEKGKDKS
jgi:hypothetical protein